MGGDAVDGGEVGEEVGGGVDVGAAVPAEGVVLGGVALGGDGGVAGAAERETARPHGVGGVEVVGEVVDGGGGGGGGGGEGEGGGGGGFCWCCWGFIEDREDGVELF